jgi:hypothetical protein
MDGIRGGEGTAGVNEGATMGLQYSRVAAVPRSHASGVVDRRDGGT